MSKARTLEAEVVEPVGADEVDATALSTISRAEIDVQIATAKRFPRSVDLCLKEAELLATMDEDTASMCYYRLPRKDKKGKTKNIEGPSVHLARIMASSWGNIHAATTPLGAGEKVVTVRGVAWDLEKNLRVGVDVTRGIRNSDGRRYSDDMINVTTMAASAIAYRNAVFNVIPSPVVSRILEKAKDVSTGKGMTIEKRRERAFAWFATKGYDQAAVLKLLDRPGLADVDVDDLITLTGIKTAVTVDKEATLEEIFSTAREAGPEVVRPASLTPEQVQAGAATGQDDAKREPEKATEPKPRKAAPSPPAASQPPPEPASAPQPAPADELERAAMELFPDED